MRHFFVILFGLLASYTLAQEKDAARVSLNTINGQVLIEITVFQGNVCNGMTIYHSNDSINFEVVGNISGVCGSLTEPIVYDFEDESPTKNALNYYYVDLNGIGNSNVASIFVIDAGVNDYVLWPNPASTITTVFFQNDFQDEVNIYIYDLDGKIALTASTTSTQIEIDLTNFQSGSYFFSLNKEGEQKFASGKMVVAK